MASILVIEDDLQMRGLLKDILVQAGYEVQLASNGDEGLQLLRQVPVDLVITDLFMPDRDGLEVIMTLRRDSPPIPIIVCTGNAESVHYLNAAKYLGAQRTLAKPFLITELLQAVREELQKLS